MTLEQRERLKHSLRTLAEYQTATMRLFEETFSLLCTELSMEPLAYFQNFFQTPMTAAILPGLLRIDQALLSVTFRGKTCFLGSTLPFRFLAHLAQRPNIYITYADLLDEVWLGSKRSDSAVRSVAKILRKKLRRAGLVELAEAIDGSETGHFALKLPE